MYRVVAVTDMNNNQGRDNQKGRKSKHFGSAHLSREVVNVIEM